MTIMHDPMGMNAENIPIAREAITVGLCNEALESR